jgi:hypothetical protein
LEAATHRHLLSAGKNMGTSDADAGHERGGVLILGGGHSFAESAPLADRRLEQAAGAGSPVLDILASVNDRLSKRLADGYGAP